jgi:hypothetical protein
MENNTSKNNFREDGPTDKNPSRQPLRIDAKIVV